MDFWIGFLNGGFAAIIAHGGGNAGVRPVVVYRIDHIADGGLAVQRYIEG